MLRILLSIFAFLFFSLVTVDGVLACSCGASGTVNVEFEEMPNVVVLKLRSVEENSDPNKQIYSVGNIRRSILTVEKVFKGNLKVGQELPFAQGGGADCIWTFSEEEIGEEYLLYLGSKPSKGGLWSGIVCTRSGSTKYRSADLLYLEKLPKVSGKTRVSGRLEQEIAASVEGGYSEDRLLAGRYVYITGNGKKIKLRTDRNGVYEIYDLPPGKYKIEPERVDGYKFGRYSEVKEDFVEVDLRPKSHVEENFDFVIDNSIQGKVYDAYGRTARVCVELDPAQGKAREHMFLFDCTDENGSFEIDTIPAGSYVLIVNNDGKMNGDHPFGRFYYPNKVERSDATKISIGPGEHQFGLLVTAPTTLETVVFSGRLLFEDGKPVANEFVKFFKDSGVARRNSYHPDINAKTNENGEFSIRLIKGVKGSIVGTLITYSGKYENCPKLEAAIKASGSSVPTLETTEIKVDPITDLSEIELRFPFPSCKRAKDD
ncbi:MAG TPA: hypothetical protein PKC65_02415 [Pyrinomonadaceae bacterium]|nr:hypothetical protein [Pyrinomonadaceae bacterium]